jgi:hypothetical protein
VATSDPKAERLSALRDWLIVERAYEQGRASDTDVNLSQDRITTLLGPRAISVTAEYLNEKDGAPDTLGHLIGDRLRLLELLKLIEDKRRPGFEVQSRRPDTSDRRYWRVATATERSGDPDDTALTRPRPVALLVMAEYGVTDPVWDRPHGDGGPVDLDELGVSADLIRQLRDWNEVFEHLALTDFTWSSPEAESAWADEGLRLAYLLQNELPDISIRYFHHDDDRPLRG